MTAYRSRRELLRYQAHRKRVSPSVCEFCALPKEQVLQTTGQFMIIKNRFPYSIWDGQTVVDHLMVVPKKHTDTLVSFNSSMLIDYFDILKKYEAQGYNVHARAPSSKIKTVVHQHTHLIKTEGRPKRFLLLIRRPLYIRLVKS